MKSCGLQVDLEMYMSFKHTNDQEKSKWETSGKLGILDNAQVGRCVSIWNMMANKFAVSGNEWFLFSVLYF